MLKKLTVLMAALALAAPVFAQGDADQPVRLRGAVKEVKADEGKKDAGTFSMAVKGKESEDAVVFAVNADTVIKDSDKVLKLADLKVGDKVRVDYKEADGKKLASKIRLENDEK